MAGASPVYVVRVRHYGEFAQHFAFLDIDDARPYLIAMLNRIERVERCFMQEWKCFPKILYNKSMADIRAYIENELSESNSYMDIKFYHDGVSGDASRIKCKRIRLFYPKSRNVKAARAGAGASGADAGAGTGAGAGMGGACGDGESE